MKNYKKQGMILIELLVALVLCGVLMGLSIYMFKSNDVTKTPKIYSVLKNLPEVNNLVASECYREGSCSDMNSLPTSVSEYCTRLADNFVTAGTPECSGKTSATDVNFRLSNGISFNGMNNTSWQTLTGTRKYIDIYIDTDGPNNGANEVGKDIFPIRIFNNGDVVPSKDSDFTAFDDEEFFSYRVIVDRAIDNNNRTIRKKEVVNADMSEDGSDNGLPFREKVSFREAVCISNPTHISRYFAAADAGCDDFDTNLMCNFSADATYKSPYIGDKSAFCTIQPVKPKGSGIFKMFGI